MRFGPRCTRRQTTAKAGPEGAGDAWTWTAIDADTKLVAAWMIGPRDGGVAEDFMQDLASRLASRVQLAVYGLQAYLEAVEGTLGADIDYAPLVTLYSDAPNAGPERKYSANGCLGTRPPTVTGSPDMARVCPSYVERLSLTMWMSLRRLTA